MTGEARKSLGFSPFLDRQAGDKKPAPLDGHLGDYLDAAAILRAATSRLSRGGSMSVDSIRNAPQ